LRCFYIVNNVEYGESIFSKIIRASKRGDRFFPFNSGMNLYDFIDYNDCCNQIAKSVEQDTFLGIINICSGVPIRLSERVESFIRDNNLNISLEYGKYPDRKYDSKAIWGDCTIIKKILSFGR